MPTPPRTTFWKSQDNIWHKQTRNDGVESKWQRVNNLSHTTNNDLISALKHRLEDQLHSNGAPQSSRNARALKTVNLLWDSVFPSKTSSFEKIHRSAVFIQVKERQEKLKGELESLNLQYRQSPNAKVIDQRKTTLLELRHLLTAEQTLLIETLDNWRTKDQDLKKLETQRDTLKDQIGRLTDSSDIAKAQEKLHAIRASIRDHRNTLATTLANTPEYNTITKELARINQAMRFINPVLNRDFIVDPAAATPKFCMTSERLEKATTRYLEDTKIPWEDHDGETFEKSIKEWQQELQTLTERHEQLSREEKRLEKDENLGKKALEGINRQRQDLTDEIKTIQYLLRRNPGNVFRSIMDHAIRSQKPDQSNWELTKSALVEESPFFMGVMTDFRKQYVDRLLKKVLDQLEEDNQADQEFINKLKAIKIQAFGSNNLTSDYDITIFAGDDWRLTAPEYIESEIVGLFNSFFRREMGEESGSFFDTNLYTRGLAPDIDSELGTKQSNGVRANGKGSYKWKNPDLEIRHNIHQDVLSLVKQRKHMTKDQWNKYVELLIKHSPIKIQAEIQRRYDLADRICKQYFGEEGELRKKIGMLKDDPSYKHLSAAGLELTASNILYIDLSQTSALEVTGIGEEHRHSLLQRTGRRTMPPLSRTRRPAQQPSLSTLAGINSRRQGQPDNYNKEETRMKYFWGLGKALLFANEPYFSEGTLRHVVANEQALKHEPPKLTVTAEQGLQSINENFGDIEKELHHLAGESFATIAIKSSKYLGRFTRAIDITVKELEKSSSDFGKLKKSKAFKLLLKQKNALQSIEAELLSLRAGKPLPKKAKSHDEYVASLFNGQKALHRIKEGDDLRHFVEKIALYVNGTFRPLLWSGLKEEALSRMHESIEL